MTNVREMDHDGEESAREKMFMKIYWRSLCFFLDCFFQDGRDGKKASQKDSCAIEVGYCDVTKEMLSRKFHLKNIPQH
jgi:hypothetical protein